MKPHLLIFCMLATALPSSAQTAAFQRLDRNGDGKLTREDDRRGAALERCFQELDTNGDGKLSREELGDAQQHASWDRDQDGFVTPAEVREFMASIRRARSLLATAPAATVAEGIDVHARPSAPPAAVPVAKSRSFADLSFARDWVPGTKDGAGERMSGTETVRLLAHGGRLFAATGCWMDLPYGRRGAGQPPWTGPQILVKDSAQAAWRVDVSWPMARRVTAILSTRFVTDGDGKSLAPPVTILRHPAACAGKWTLVCPRRRDWSPSPSATGSFMWRAGW